MAKMYIVEGKKYDIIVLPRQFACRLTKYYWVAINQSCLGLFSEWGDPPRKLGMPHIDSNATEDEIKNAITDHYGVIVAEREDGNTDKGFIAIDKKRFDKLIERHGIPGL